MPRTIIAFMVDRIDPKPGEILFAPSCGNGGFLICAIRHIRDRYVNKPKDEQAIQISLRAALRERAVLRWGGS